MNVRVNPYFLYDSKCYLKHISCFGCKKESSIYDVKILDHVLHIYPEGWGFDNFVDDNGNIRYIAYCEDCMNDIIDDIESYKEEIYEDR